jgi:hypothetical protein
MERKTEVAREFHGEIMEEYISECKPICCGKTLEGEQDVFEAAR